MQSLRRCRHCERACVVRGGGNNPKRVCCLFDVINIVAINGNIFIKFICFASGLNLYDGQLFIHVQFHVNKMKLAYVCSYNIRLTFHTSESEISTDWSQ